MLEYGDMTINVDFDIACKLIRIKDTFFLNFFIPLRELLLTVTK